MGEQLMPARTTTVAAPAPIATKRPALAIACSPEVHSWISAQADLLGISRTALMDRIVNAYRAALSARVLGTTPEALHRGHH
jgi:hypothetical protein